MSRRTFRGAHLKQQRKRAKENNEEQKKTRIREKYETKKIERQEKGRESKI
jgi:hypothetical protein